MEDYRLEEDAFVIEEYDKKPPFTSFLPGLAGRKGIPLWAFYVNRGQGICSFGINDKDHAAMEFDPAVAAYENTDVKGFRTLLRVDGKVFQPFFEPGKNKRTMFIRENSLSLQEDDEESGIRTTVRYFLIPNEDFGALVRRVTFQNRTNHPVTVEALDGMPRIVPYGIKNSEFKQMSNLLRSWTDIRNLKPGMPFYTLRATTDDCSEVGQVNGGWFLISVQSKRVIYDAAAIFGEDTSLREPQILKKGGLSAVFEQKQCFSNHIPCGFFGCSGKLLPGESLPLDVLYSFSETPQKANARAARIRAAGYLAGKEQETEKIVAQLTDDVRTQTGEPLFDRYIRQCYLDNLLRGGYPFVFGADGGKQTVFHLFSRKHGDPERDYNFFSTAGEYYSQGNGNFRDVCQNRRNDVLFHPPAGEENIRTFASLLQADGYNPLEVRATTFTVLPQNKDCLVFLLNEANVLKLRDIFKNSFTPGQISKRIASEGYRLAMPEDEFLSKLLDLCEKNIEAVHKEGFWSDHFTYLLDLIENYRLIFPDQMQRLLFTEGFCRTYNSPCRVLPRKEKYCLANGQPRQYGAVVEDSVKKEKGIDPDRSNWLQNTDQSFVESSLYSKLLQLAVVKFCTLDPEGMGIEMEAGKPGWNDAMNGLPGLFGSDLSETFELKRLILFLCSNDGKFNLPEETATLIHQINVLLKTEGLSSFDYWDWSASLREQYRDSVRFSLNGKQVSYTVRQLTPLYNRMLEKLHQGIMRAKEYGNGLVPTYFYFEATSFKKLCSADGTPITTPYGLPAVRISAFRAIPLPHFLEAPARMMKVLDHPEEGREICHLVKKSALYDRQLKMYKNCVSLQGVSMETGRICAFSPGWQERESVFLHMEYKYLLGILTAGFPEIFYEEMKKLLIPFQPPERYGRSILENSSFLASSSNPDPRVHGRGFVCRLSGSTTEALSMWAMMMMGNTWFTCKEQNLCLQFSPILPGWLFDKQGDLSFRLLSSVTVTYHNPMKRNTYGAGAVHPIRIDIPGVKSVKGDTLCGEDAASIRRGDYQTIGITLGLVQ